MIGVRRSEPLLGWILAAASLAGSCLYAFPAYADAADNAPAASELLLEVEINGVPKPEPAIVRDSPAMGLLLRTADLAAWGIRTPPSDAPVKDQPDLFVSVTAIQGLRARIDFAHQRLIVVAAPSLLQSIDMPFDDRVSREPMPSVPGAFIGYDVVGGSEDGARTAAGQFNVGGFAGAWNGTNTWQAQAESSLVAKRLDTTLGRDWPERMLALRLGDAITTPGSWGRAVRLGGIRWGTDFSARPDFITFPLPAVRGEAAVPSTVDVYVNDTLRARREVQPGAFSIRDLPVITGSGDVRLVVRDALGREQLVEQPYFASEELLRAGLSMHSVEIGAIREDYGLENFEYGRALAVAGYRRGLTDWLTGEVRAEILKNQQTAGAGVSAQIRPGVVVSAALARSETDSAGSLARVGIDLSRRAFSAGIRVQAASDSFRQVGQLEGDGPSRSLDAHLGWAAGRAGSFGVVFANREFRTETDVRIVSMTYGLSLGALGYLGAFATYDLDDSAHSQLALTLTRSVGDRTSSHLSATVDSGRVGAGVAVSRSLPAGEGAGFHVEAEQGEFDRVGAGIANRLEAATIGADVERAGQRTRYRGYVSGGAVFMGGGLAAVRDIDTEHSFAIVEVPLQPGVPIYHDNHKVAVTDSRGRALLAGLRPYEPNRLQIDLNDLPIDVAIASDQFSVRPYRLGGVRVRFPVADHGGAVVHLVRSSADVVPAGAIVKVGTQQFTVAGDGAVYLVGLAGTVTLEARWRGHRCTARLTIPADRVLPDLGSARCEEAM